MLTWASLTAYGSLGFRYENFRLRSFKDKGKMFINILVCNSLKILTFSIHSNNLKYIIFITAILQLVFEVNQFGA